MSSPENAGRFSRRSRGRLAATALVRLAAGVILLSALLFLPAGTAEYWEAWVYLAVLFVPVTLGFLYLIEYDPELLERRMRTRERDAGQTLLVKLGSACYLLAFLLPGFDRRFGWSHVPVGVVVAADVLIVLGYGLFILVLRENRFASRIVEVQEGQRIVTTGPYAIVRHPMYLAVLVMFVVTPVALGSWWAAISICPLLAILVARIMNEEQLLEKELKGYREYMQANRFRLVPGVW